MSVREALRITVSGRVQGVGFRYFTAEKARFQGLSGWVRNLPDGRVEALAIGERPHLEAFLADVRRGPPQSRVSDVAAEWSKDVPAGYDTFDVVQ